MMNLLQVQDDLKNFSQDQLVKEMQQPSGSTPQFLVLSELNRRKRVKGNLEARQAQNQPTVAEEAVASAGVPQSGMMGMSEAMAPQSMESGGIGSMMPKTMKNGGEVEEYAEGGVIRAQSGYRGVGKGGYDTRGDSFRAPSDPTISDDFEQTGNVDVGGLFGFGQEDARTLQEILKSGPKTMEELEILEQSEIQAEKQSPLVVSNETEENIVPSPKLNLTSGDENKTLSIEEELLKRQAGLDKSRNFDKYMALAQAGLGILASEKPTLAGAIGEGGMQGLDAFNAANKRYEEGITDILNARSKIQQARIAAGAKGKLTRSGAIQALNSFSTSISSKEKMISDIITKSVGVPTDEQKDEIAALRESIKDLQFQKSQLFGEAKIRPRPSINVGKLPSTQKAS